MPWEDGDRYAAKACVGDRQLIDAIIIVDGHEKIGAAFKYRHESERKWQEQPLILEHNDHWKGELKLEKLGYYFFKFEAWMDPLESWIYAVQKKHEAGETVLSDLQAGSSLLQSWMNHLGKRTNANLRKQMQELSKEFGALNKTPEAKQIDAWIHQLREWAKTNSYRHLTVEHDLTLTLEVEREIAEFGAWYEFFPRSASRKQGQHGTFRDCEEVLPYVADLGFDVVYFPPIHPIGAEFRKGPNNTLKAGPNDPGSPWAIGGEGGGHKAIHHQLGTMKNFESLLKKAKSLNLEVALDLAFQCSANHPYLKKHPEWFRRRPDGTIQYAENPPKKYQDIYPFDFESEQFQALWDELRSVIDFWVEKGVRIFRVDNPHTKSFLFWRWAIDSIRRKNPDVILLSEAFTRPNMVYHLAKIGFSQSYTYFTWRNTKEELAEYLAEITSPPLVNYFRPNFWPNTPDILSGRLRKGTIKDFKIRYFLAATMVSSYGIYGPAFELMENTPQSPTNEEYLHSEKYEVRKWAIEEGAPYNELQKLIQKTNQIRKSELAFRRNRYVHVHDTDNAELLAYSRKAPDSSAILCIVNLDSGNPQSGWTDLDLPSLGLEPEQEFEVEDLLDGSTYQWRGPKNFVKLTPERQIAHLFKIKPKAGVL